MTPDDMPASEGSIREIATNQASTSQIATTEISIIQYSVFLTIALEIRTEIYSYLLPHHCTIDITIPHKKRGVIPARFMHVVPNLRDAILLGVCEQTKGEAMDYMYRNNRFVSQNADSINKLPDLLGDDGVGSIRHLELNMHFMQKTHRLNVWISALKFLTEKLVSLERFILRTVFDADADAFPETSGDSRWGQERRALLRFGAFMTLRSPKLGILVWRADSGLSYEPNQRRVHGRVELYSEEKAPRLSVSQRYENPGDTVKKPVSDLILNSTAIRHTAWVDLDKKLPVEFALDSTATTSEPAETNLNFRPVHRFSYLPSRERTALGDLNPSNSIDLMIRQAEKATKRQEERRVEADRRETEAARLAEWRANLPGVWGAGQGGRGRQGAQGRGDAAAVRRGGQNVVARANLNVDWRGGHGRDEAAGLGRGDGNGLAQLMGGMNLNGIGRGRRGRGYGNGFGGENGRRGWCGRRGGGPGASGNPLHGSGSGN